MKHSSKNPTSSPECSSPECDELGEILRRCSLPSTPDNLCTQLTRRARRTRRVRYLKSVGRGFIWSASLASVALVSLAFVAIYFQKIQITPPSLQFKYTSGQSGLFASNDDSLLGQRGQEIDKNTLHSAIQPHVLNLSQRDIKSQDITAILDVPMDLKDAIVRISLDSGIELRDLPGLSVVEWTSDFVKGDNSLSLALAVVEENVDKFNSVQIRLSHPSYSTEVWINIARADFEEI